MSGSRGSTDTSIEYMDITRCQSSVQEETTTRSPGEGPAAQNSLAVTPIVRNDYCREE